MIKKTPINELKKVLKLVMVKLGLRAINWPAEEEKIVLCQHILTNFGGNGSEEILLAFDLAIAGKLDLKDDEIKCYENFSCAYFSMIMNAYRRWAIQEYKYLEKSKTPEQKVFTQEELDNLARKDVEWKYGMFLSGIKLIFPQAERDILLKDKLINPEEFVLDFYKRIAEKGLKNIYKEEK